MSRTYKQAYTKSKRFDKTCRCNGGCSYCYSNRMHKNNKRIHNDIDDEIQVYVDRYEVDYDSPLEDLLKD